MPKTDRGIKANRKYPRGESTCFLPPLGWVRGVRGKAGLGIIAVPGSTTLYSKIDIPAVPDKRVRYWKSIKAYWSFSNISAGEGDVQLYIAGEFHWISQLGNEVEYLIPRDLLIVQPQNTKATLYFRMKNYNPGAVSLYYDYWCLEFFDDWELGRGKGIDNPAATIPLEP